MTLTLTQSDDLRTHLQEGAIYRDRSNNVIRLLSICGDYCVYVYVVLTNLRSSMHGSVLVSPEKTHLAMISCLSRVRSKTGSEINASMMFQQSLLASFPTRLVILGQRKRTGASISPCCAAGTR
jgi:hypothetical protein